MLEGAGEVISGAVAYSFADFLYAHIAGFQIAFGAAGFELVQEGGEVHAGVLADQRGKIGFVVVEDLGELMQRHGLVVRLDIAHDERGPGGEKVVAVELDGVAVMAQHIAHEEVDETDAAEIMIAVA